jgi:hypothetical protein
MLSYGQGGVHFSEGGYGRIAVKVFNTLDVDVFYVGAHIYQIWVILTLGCYQLEYDTERAGDFEPLKYFPIGKVAVLGLVTTKNPKVSVLSDLRSYDCLSLTPSSSSPLTISKPGFTKRPMLCHRAIPSAPRRKL